MWAGLSCFLLNRVGYVWELLELQQGCEGPFGSESSYESTLCTRWPKYWSFSFSIIPSKEIPGLIFRTDWLDLLADQGTLKSLLQHHTSKASILRCSAFFTVQLSHPYIHTGKTIALTRQTFVDKCLCFLICCLGWS